MLNTNKKAQKWGQIMGIKVISSPKTEVLSWVEEKITHNIKFNIVTPNPELILMAQKNDLLKKSLNEADLAISDGVGLKLAIPDLQIIKGRELFMDLINLANKNKWKVFLLGGMDNEAELAEMKIKEMYKDIKIQSDQGWKLNNEAEPVAERDGKICMDTVDRINKFFPDLLFVAFGNPKQEIWIHKNIKALNIRCAMTVGGTLRYISGLSKLPPKWMDKVGLEWLWRLITEPKRMGRIFNAVVIFPLRVFFYKILGK